MKTLRLIAAAMLSSTLAISAAADATIYRITYTGHVTSGYDNAGVFGSPNTDLTGAAYRAIFFLDSTKGRYYENEYGTTMDFYSWLPSLSSPLTSILKINGGLLRNDGNYQATNAYENGYPNGTGYDYLYHEAINVEKNNNIYTENQIFIGLATNSNDIVPGYGYISNLNYKTKNEGDGYFFSVDYDDNNYIFDKVRGRLDVDRVSIKPALSGAIPEPSTWALMILGFGGIGAALRRRRKTPITFATA